MSAEDALTEIATSNQLLLESVKEGGAKGFLKYLKEIDKNIRERITRLETTPFTKSEERSLLKDLTEFQQDIYDQYFEDLNIEFEELAIEQAAIEAEAMTTVFAEAKAVEISRERLVASYRRQPLNAQGWNGDRLLSGFFKKISEDNIYKVNNTIASMASRSATIDEIVRAIRGTKKGKYLDGILGKTNENVRMAVRTGYQHVATSAKVETMQSYRRFTKGYRYRAVIDSRTTPICRGIDNENKVYEWGKGPVPPMHIGCRSQIVAVPKNDAVADEDKGKRIVNFGGEPYKVDADKSYYEILADQPKGIREAVLGKTKAKLFDEGGLTPKEFGRLTLNQKTFEPLTIAEMKAKRPDIFRKAGI
jgi:SPP1 gp7 family putative phage head morphogenesis protein